MKAKRLAMGRFIVILALSYVLAAGCGGGGGGGGGSGSIQGEWICELNEDVNFGSERQPLYVDTIALKFDGSEYFVIMFESTVQVMGETGTFSINGDTVTLTSEYKWETDQQSNDVYEWVETSGSSQLTASIGESTMTLTNEQGDFNCTRLGDHFLDGQLINESGYHWIDGDSNRIIFTKEETEGQYEQYRNWEVFVDSGEWWCSGSYIFMNADRIAGSEEDKFLMYCAHYSYASGRIPVLTFTDPDDSAHQTWTYEYRIIN